MFRMLTHLLKRTHETEKYVHSSNSSSNSVQNVVLSSTFIGVLTLLTRGSWLVFALRFCSLLSASQ